MKAKIRIDPSGAFMKEYSRVLKEKPKLLKKELAKAFVEEAIRITPKDTGRARAGWSPAARALGVPTTDQSNEGSIQEKDDRVIITNSVPYIKLLDAGYSKQAPQGITRPAMKYAISKAGSIWQKLWQRVSTFFGG